MRINNTQGLKEHLQNASHISIIGHKNPDGDALGSALGLYFFFKDLGLDSQVIMPNAFPDFLKWLPDSEHVLTYDAQPHQCEKLIEHSDVVFTLDFNHLERTGQLGEFLNTLNATYVMIDHHQEPGDYAQYQLVDTEIASTCELVYEFITSNFENQPIRKEVATGLYTGIMTDTGSFRYPLTSSKTHRIIAELIDAGAPNSQIHQNTFDNNNESRLHLLGQALQNLKVLKDYKTAYIYLSQEDLNKNNFKKGDTEGFVNYALSLKGIKFALIFIENKDDNIIKISLRSIGDFDVNTFARTHYQGGGHKNAAGGKSDLDLTSTLKKFETILKSYKDHFL
jgi:phosphoesterase RecJ-like protein